MNEYLRRATIDDKDVLFEWVNDPITRSSAFNTGLISYECHCEWYQKILQDEKVIQLIYMVDEECVGQVRLNIFDDMAELDYSISPNYRHMGYGKKMIWLLQNYICENLSQITRVLSRVKGDNVGSRKVMEDTDFSTETVVYMWEPNSL